MLRATALKISEVLLKTEGGEVTLTRETACVIGKKAQSALAQNTNTTSCNYLPAGKWAPL